MWISGERRSEIAAGSVPSRHSRRARRILGVVLPIFLIPAGSLVPAAPVSVTADGLVLRLSSDGSIREVRVGDRVLPTGSLSGGVFVADVGRYLGPLGRPLPIHGGFENPDGSRPRGWTAGADWSVDRREHHSGAVSMRVEVPGTRPRSSGELSATLPVRPNALYRASVWMKTRGCAPHFYIVFLDEKGRSRRGRPQLVVSHNRKNADWFRLERVFTTPPFCSEIRLYVRLWRQNGTAWVDDVVLERLDRDLVAPQHPARGTVKRAGRRIVVESSLPRSELRLRTVYEPRDGCIEVSGDVEDLSGRDRAITLSFRLPVALTGWRWFDDLRNSQTIRPGVTYGAARAFGDGRLLGVYPFAVAADGETGIAMAVRMDDPSVFRLCARTDRGMYASYEFGLTRAASRFPGRAHWRCVLYPCDRKWGLRSAAQRYYRFFPEFFRKRVRSEGGAGFMPDLARLTSEDPPWNPPAFAIYNWHNRAAVPDLRLEGVRLFSYTEFSGWWGWAVGITPDEAARKPSPEAAWNRIEELAKADPPNRVAQCILNCNPRTRDGRPFLHRVYVPKWGGYNYVCNPDPEIRGVGGLLNRFTLTMEREVSKVRTFHLDGMYYDCVFVFETDNFRREHFRWADHPLAFDHVTGRPVLPLAFSIYECAETISRVMHDQGKLVMANYSVTNHPVDVFCMQFVDVIGNEMLWTTPTESKLMLERTLAARKTLSMSWQEAKNSWTAERVARDMKHAMAWGAFYYLSGMDPETYHRGLRLTQRLAGAGWEPVTLATVVPDSCVLERFGSAGEGNLQFTLRNPGKKPVTCQVSFDAAALGITAVRPQPELWVCPGPFEYRRIPLKRGGRIWTAGVTAGPADTLVLRLATPAGRALDQLLIIREAAGRAAAFASALRTTIPSLPAVDAGGILRLADRAEGLVRTGRAREAASIFRRMGATIPLPPSAPLQPEGVGTASGKSQQHRRRVQRLRFYLTELRTAIQGAQALLSPSD